VTGSFLNKESVGNFPALFLFAATATLPGILLSAVSH